MRIFLELATEGSVKDAISAFGEDHSDADMLRT
jgi:hypothetical protein